MRYYNCDLNTAAQTLELKDLAELQYYIHAIQYERLGPQRGYYI